MSTQTLWGLVEGYRWLLLIPPQLKQPNPGCILSVVPLWSATQEGLKTSHKALLLLLCTRRCCGDLLYTVHSVTDSDAEEAKKCLETHSTSRSVALYFREEIDSCCGKDRFWGPAQKDHSTSLLSENNGTCWIWYTKMFPWGCFSETLISRILVKVFLIYWSLFILVIQIVFHYFIHYIYIYIYIYIYMYKMYICIRCSTYVICIC